MDQQIFEQLRRVEASFQNGGEPAEEHFELLLNRTGSASPALRERALLLLLQPPVSDEIGYQRRLLVQLQRWVATGAVLPRALWEWFLEWLVFVHADGSRPGPGWAVLAAKVPLSVWRKFRERPFSARVFLAHMKDRRAFTGRIRLSSADSRRWRLLKSKLPAEAECEPWAELTVRDLGILGVQPGRQRRFGWRRGRWLRVGRAIAADPVASVAASVITRRASRPLGETYWGGLGCAGRRYLESVLALQVEELRAVRRLAVEVSRATRRVVLSCHNASLAAMGGWAFESLDRQFPDRRRWQRFQREAEAAGQAAHRNAAHPEPALVQLWDLWEQRLVAPKRAQADWEQALRQRMATAINPQAAAPDADPNDPEPSHSLPDPAGTWNFGWSGPLQPCQHPDPAALQRWVRLRQRFWLPGFHRLRRMLDSGAELLAQDRIEHLVLPWIDKFFISSLRQQDIGYLAALVDWLEATTVRPLVLLWEDSAHARDTSLALALAANRERKWRGIGRFDAGVSDRSQALEIICRDHEQTELFALRPINEIHQPGSLDDLLRTRPRQFLQRYDSAWKDNQVCIYTGTQVFPLLSVQSDPEPLPCWIAVNGHKLPLGAFLRNRLRRAALSDLAADEPLEPLAAGWQQWAALG